MGVRFGAKTDLLENDNVAAGRLLLPFFSLILELAIIHDAADGRPLHRRDLNQVKSRSSRHAQRLVDRNDADLVLILIDHPDGRYVDPFIKSRCFFDGWLPFKKTANAGRQRMNSEAV